MVRASIAATARDGGVFNIGTARETSVVDLYAACLGVAGSESAAELAPARLGELQRSVLDASLAARELDWRPETTLADGLRATWEWIRQE